METSVSSHVQIPKRIYELRPSYMSEHSKQGDPFKKAKAWKDKP